MRILIYFEQFSCGGVDTHLLTLLQEWPEKKDEIIVLSNAGNAGFSRTKAKLNELKYVQATEIKSFSHSVFMNAVNSNKAVSLLRPFCQLQSLCGSPGHASHPQRAATWRWHVR